MSTADTTTTTTSTIDAIEREVFIEAGIERVWSLVSKAGFWIGEELHFETQAAEGEVVEIHTEQYGTFPVEVTRLDAPRYAAYRWASSEPGASLTPTNATLVEFTLAERDGGVQVQVRESGFAGLPEASFRSNSEGWAQQMARLQVAATASTTVTSAGDR